MSFVRRVSLVVLGVVVAACGSDGGPPFAVTSTMVSHDKTQDVWVWAPDDDGPFPVVFGVPGSGGSARLDLETIATELATGGIVVFATDWQTDGDIEAAAQDLECGYRLTRTIAADHGGDLSQPITLVGFSLGASAGLLVGIESDLGPDGNYDECFAGMARPDAIVAIAGCHNMFDLPSFKGDWGNRDVELFLVSGSDDTACPTSETEYAEGILLADGYGVTRVEIQGAGHGQLVFRDQHNDWAPLSADDPLGQQTVAIILDAIEAAR